MNGLCLSNTFISNEYSLIGLNSSIRAVTMVRQFVIFEIMWMKVSYCAKNVAPIVILQITAFLSCSSLQHDVR